MRASKRRWVRLAGLATGMVLLFNSSACLPKDYFYNFAAAGRSTILSTFADAVFGSITDALFPGVDNDNDNTNGNDNSNAV